VLRPLVAIVLVGCLSVGVTACGESAADKAKDNACDAVDDINTQVSELQTYTLTTVTKDKLDSNINSIKSDLGTIKDSLPDLKASLKSQLEAATNTFEQQFSQIASSVGQSVSIQDAAKQVTSDSQQLKSSYDKAFASVSC
jgi:chromosome segregation ATPase